MFVSWARENELTISRNLGPSQQRHLVERDVS